jgi:hypothetical protein
LAIDDEASGSDTGVEWNGRKANSIKNGDGKAKGEMEKRGDSPILSGSRRERSGIEEDETMSQ